MASTSDLRNITKQRANKRERPEDAAIRLLERFEILRPAVPVSSLAEKLGVRVVFSDLGSDVSGALVRQGKTALIAVNSTQHKKRQRFSIAHELGHFLLNHEGMESHVDRQFTVLRRDANSSTASDFREIEANGFAAALLMPADFIYKEFVKHGVFTDELIDRLAERYSVSSLAFKIRLTNLGFYSPL